MVIGRTTLVGPAGRTLTAMSVAVARTGPMTIVELWELPDDGRRHELVDGVLVVTPSPGAAHQDAVAQLHLLLAPALPPDLKVMLSPFDWVAGPASVFEPDLLVARRDDIGPLRLEHPPVLAVEVLSPSTRHVDRGLKRSAYASAGVAHYWLVDPTVPSLTVLRLAGDAYVEMAVLQGDEALVVAEPFAVTVVPSALRD